MRKSTNSGDHLMTIPALEFRDTVVSFRISAGWASLLSTKAKTFNAVDHVSLSVQKGEILGIVGESGSGKTTISKAALGLHPINGGDILLNGRQIDNESLGKGTMQMVFQDPLSSLNPRQTVFEALSVPLLLHQLVKKNELNERIDKLLADVGLATHFYNRFPHELSGGQLQRVAIARALATQPTVLFADEAVSKLDVSVRAQILNLLKRLRDTYNLTIVFVSHDLYAARFLCDRIAVMYFGKLVEIGETSDIYANALHPYTKELLGTLDKVQSRSANARDGYNPATDDATACRYLKRCQQAMDVCQKRHPEMTDIKASHSVACSLYET